MLNVTTLNQFHKDNNAKMVDFAGWEMPINYGSQIAEHHAVRNDAGMFDVSHMTVIDIMGVQAKEFVQYLVANDVNKLRKPGKALYSCMLNEHGGVLDDLIVYYFSDSFMRIISNSATRTKNVIWITRHATEFSVTVVVQEELDILALQGPNAIEKYLIAYPEYKSQLKQISKFQAIQIGDIMIAKTGYTGEIGLEVILPKQQTCAVAQNLLQHGFKPIGLAARDTLRLEAGMALYGNELSETISPLEAGLAWTVNFNKDFIGKNSLYKQKENGIARKLIGIELTGKGVIRSHQKLIDTNYKTGIITSGTYSPTLNKSIGLALVDVDFDVNDFNVEIRNSLLTAMAVKYPFI